MPQLPPYQEEEPDNGHILPAYTDADSDYIYTFHPPEKPGPAPEYEDAFPITTPAYNDTFFTYLFAVVVIIFSGLVYRSYHTDPSLFSSLQPLSSVKSIKATDPITQLYILISISTITPFITSAFLLSIVYTFPTLFLIIAFSLVPISLAAISFSLFSSGSFISGAIFGLMASFSLSFMFNCFSSFTFSAIVLKQVTNATLSHKSSILISFISSIISVVISTLYLLSIYTIMHSRLAIDDSYCPHTNGNDICISNTSIFIALFSLFTGFYILQVIQNTTHVVLAGIFASWYFFNSKPDQPTNAAAGSIKRAFTYCFGSICFGSLLVSLIQTTKVTLSLIKSKLRGGLYNNTDPDSNQMILCFLLCFVSFLEWITSEFEYWIKWFNRYAYSYLAIYGKPYLQSARDTFEILKYKGLDILINDSLISTAINLYSILSVIITSIVIFISYKISLNGMASEMLIIGSVGSLITTWFITNTMMNILDVGSVTFMIGLSVDPEAFIDPNSIERMQTWESLQRHYPGLREKVMLDWPEM